MRILLLISLLWSFSFWGCESGENSLDDLLSERSKINVPYRTFLFGRVFFEDIKTTQLIVLKSLEDQDRFLDSTSTLFYFPRFESYDDSMLVGIIYGDSVSVSTTFAIDSVLLDSVSNEITIFSHVFDPIGKMSIFANPSHFIVIPKFDVDVQMNEITYINETTDGEIISFRSLIKGHHLFQNNSSSPRLIALRNENEEDAFLDSTSLYHPFEFPEFTYDDSMLVGVIMDTVYIITPFEIVSLIRKQDRIGVTAQMFFGFPSLPDPGFPSHFIVIASTNSNITLNEIEHIVNNIE